MSDNLELYFKENNNASNYLDPTQFNLSYIISQLQLSSLPYKKLFSKHKYTLRPIKEIDQPKIVGQLLQLINEALSNQSLFIFLSDLSIKLINEHIITLEHAITLIQFYFFSSYCCITNNNKAHFNKLFFNQYLRIVVLTQNRICFDLLQSSESSLLYEAKIYLLQSEYLIDMLFFNNPIEFLSEIIKWKYSQFILSQLITQLSSVFFKNKLSTLLLIIPRQIELLKSIMSTEQKEFNENPFKLMNGIEICNGFHLENSITIPKENFNIEFSFIKHCEDSEAECTIISFSKQNRILLSFYIEKSFLCLSYYKAKTKLAQVEYGKTFHIILEQTIPRFIPFRQNKAKIYINNTTEAITVNPYNYLEGHIDFTIGSFRGQIGKIQVYKKESKVENEDIELLIDPLVLLYQYQQEKKYQLINTIEPNSLIKNIINDQNNEALDIPFECIPFKEVFNENEGTSYLLLIMSYLQSTIKKALKEQNYFDIQLVYKCIQLILGFVFDLYNDANEYRKEPLLTLFYSIILLIDQLVVIEKIPQSLIQLFLKHLSSIPNLQLKNNLFMVLINPMNISIEDFNILLKQWPSFIDKTDKYTTIFILQSLILFYQYDNTPKKDIARMINKILTKSKGDIKLNYLDKVLQINHTGHLYKLLKIWYLSLPQIIKEPLGTYEICNAMNKIYEEHSVSKDEYSVILQALLIRLIDEIFIRYELKNSKGFIHQSVEVNTRLNESSSISQNNININKIESIIENIIEKAQVNIHLLRSIFLLLFQTTNQSSNLDFIKGKSNLKALNYCNLNSKYIVATVFKVINQLKPSTPEYDEYTLILNYFLNEIINKIGEKNNQKYVDIFGSQKIFGDIYMNIIQTKAFSQENIIRDFTLMIEKTFIYHSNPFYFNFIYRLTGFDRECYLIQPIMSKMINYKFPMSCSNNCNNYAIYLSNKKNLIILLYKLLFYSSIEKKCLYDFIITYTKHNMNFPLIYNRLLYEVIHPNQKLFLIEMIMEMIIEYYILNKEVECDLFKSLLLLKNEKKEHHTIFYYIDTWDNEKDKDQNHSNFIKEIIDSEERIQQNSGVRNPYLLMNYFAIKICSFLKRDAITQSKQLYYFLNDFLEIICSDLNQHYEKTKKKEKRLDIKIQVNDVFYRKFKSKIKNKYKKNQIVTSDVIKEICDKIIAQTTNNISKISCYSYDSNVIETTNVSKSELSVLEIYSIKRNSTETCNFFDFNHEESQLNRWFKLIKVKGMKLIHKFKNELMKGTLAVFFKKYFFYNEQFCSIVQDSFNQYINHNNNTHSNFLNYPTKIRNYTTDNFTKPFLSINRHFFNAREFIVGHPYLKDKEFDTTIINDYQKYPIKFNNRFHLDCELMKLEGVYYSVLYKYKKVLIIMSKKNYAIDKKYPLSSISYIFKSKQVIIAFSEIKEVIIKRFLFQFQAVELFLLNGKSYMINFFNKEGVELFFQLLRRVQIKNKYEYQLITNTKFEFNNKKYISKWKNGQLSTFDYILLLNKYAGRSYNDLNQYPIFPWVLVNYKDISKKEYRQFEYVISIQTKEKREHALSNYDNLSLCFDEYYQIPSHFYSHYSTTAVVYYFLNKLEPFTTLNIQFQSGQLDNPNRQFYSFHQALKSIEYSNGSRELLPEFFFLPEVFLNLNYVFFGYKKGKHLINNAVLPINCFNEEEMIYLHKEILNSNRVGKSISMWIDNVFGCNQLIRKKESLNVFPGHCYEQIIKEKNLLEEDVDQLKAFILNLGQTPIQLLTSPHPIKENPNKQSNQKKQQQIVKETLPLSSLLVTENISSQLNSFRYIDIELDDIKSVLFSSNYIIILSSKRIKVFNKKKFYSIYDIQLDHTFLFMNLNCLIQINDCSYLICGNFYDKTLKIYQKERSNSIHNEKTNSYIMTLCVGMSNDKETTFYSGSNKGIITKWVFTPSKASPIKKDTDIIAHQRGVICILLSEYLNALISSGDDFYIYIRNIYSFEILSCINVGYIPKEIVLFDSMMILAFGDNAASGFTLNGVRFTSVLKKYSSPQVLEDKLILLSGTKNLIRLNPFNFTEEIFQSKLTTKKESRIVCLHLNEDEKAIDCYLSNKKIKRIYLVTKTYETKVEPVIFDYIFYPDF